MGSTGGGNGKPGQYTCCETSGTFCIKGQKDMTLKDESPGLKVSSMLLGKSRGELLTASERMKRLGQSGNDAQCWMCLVVKVKSDAVKNNTAQETGTLHP